MFRKIVIYFVLFNFLNTVLISDIDFDCYPEGAQNEVSHEEINTVVEYVFEKVFGIPDSSPEDEDDDMPDPGKIAKSFDYIFKGFRIRYIVFFQIRSPYTHLEEKEYRLFFEKHTPPPQYS